MTYDTHGRSVIKIIKFYTFSPFFLSEFPNSKIVEPTKGTLNDDDNDDDDDDDDEDDDDDD